MKFSTSLSIFLLSVLLSACGDTPPNNTSESSLPSPTPTLAPTPTIFPTPTLTPELPAHPGARAMGDMVFHNGLGMVVMFNGNEDNHLWGWNGSDWQIVGANGPEGRELGGVAYDPQRDKLVVYGGRSLTTSQCLADAWEWDDAGWQALGVLGPDVCSHFSMEYDTALGKVVLYGGGDADLNVFSDMWTWDGTQWKNLDLATPPVRFHAMSSANAFHPNLFLLGGFDVDNQMFDEFWAWDGTTWAQLDLPLPPALSHARMAFDTNRVQMVLFGGTTRPRLPFALQNDTWVLTDGAWQQVNIGGPAPSPRGGHVMAYDPVRERVVLYGGFDADDQRLADTWEWDGSTWHCMNGCEPVQETIAPSIPDPGVILYQNNPQRTGAYDFPALRAPVEVLWQARLSGGIFGSPLVADGLVYVCGDNRVYMFDAQTGEQVGSITGLGMPFSPLAIAGDLVLGGNPANQLLAYDRHSQQPVWAFNTDGAIYNAPLVVGPTVYAVSERGVYALELATGESVWEITTGDHRGFVGSPSYDNGLLFVGVGGTLLALDSTTGDIRWQIEREASQWFYSTALAHGLVYVGHDDGHFYTFDQQTGAEVWRSPLAGAGWSAPVIAEGVVYVGNKDQHIYAFDALTGEERWQFETEDWATTDPLISDGVVYVGVGNHDNREGPRPLYALDAATGQLLWSFQANSRLMTAAALGPGVVYAVTIGGTVYALSEPSAEPAPVLTAGQWSAMVYHEEREQIVLVNGGPEQGKPAAEPLELWGWDGTTWTLIDNAGPVWRNWAGVAYDSVRGVLVVHGGIQGRQYFDETWEWDGQTWTMHDGSGPRGREGAGMAYDSVRGKVVLFGGATAGPQIVGDTWEWDGQTWVQVATSGPPARFPAGTGYDPIRQQVVVYGGHDVRTSEDIVFFADFWAWDGSTWQELPLTDPHPGVRVSTSFVFDPLSQQILMFGGSDAEIFRTDLWGWDGQQWAVMAEESGMPVRSGFNIVAYDAGRGVYVLFGGVDRPGGVVVGETWEWDGQSWTCAAACED